MFVRLHDGLTLTAGELRAFLKDRLAPFEIPRRVKFVEDIPKTMVGKPLRRALVASVAESQAADNGAEPLDDASVHETPAHRAPEHGTPTREEQTS